MLEGHVTAIKIQSTRQGPVCHDRYYPPKPKGNKQKENTVTTTHVSRTRHSHKDTVNKTGASVS